MTLSDPYTIETPPGTRAIGQAQYWEPGTTVTWTFRRFDFDRDRAEVARPMRVIADGPEGAVLWLAGGVPTRETRIVGWEDTNPHDVPLKARFRPPAEAPRRIIVPGTWHGRGVLKIVPPRVPFSVWVLLKDTETGVASGAGGAGASGGAGGTGVDGGMRAEWYVNLEAAHARSDDALFTSDHILDITFPLTSMPLHTEDGGFDASGAVFKDVDELAAAANFGAWPGRWSEIIRGNGTHLLDHLGDFSWALDPGWETVARDLASGVAPTESSFDQEHRSIPSGCYDRHHR